MLIFDWDGTLCDSLARIVQCLQLAAADSGMSAPGRKQAQEIIGLGLDDVFEKLFPNSSTLQLKDLRDNYVQHFLREDAEPSPLYPGVEQTLEDLKNQGFVLAVATGKSRAGLDRVLAALGMADFFNSSRCADETASKPNPLMLQSLLEEQSLLPHQALMVGDTTFDMEMAQRSGMPRVAVSYGAHDLERLMTYDPIAHLDAFGDIRKYI